MATKKNTMAYDKTVDYQALINQAAAKGDYSAAAKYEQQRNEKISGENLGYSQTSEYAAYLPKSYDGVEYDLATDYMSKINQAMRNGDYSAAAKYEQQRNAKIDGENLGYGKTYLTYTPQYDDEINSLLGKLLNREKFSYDASTDPLYQQYKTLYTQQGKTAMQDTMGQAAALTGGYGSSYSQAVGQQQYDAYLQKLNEIVPDLYSQAYQMYRDEGDALLDQYQIYLNRDAQDYERHKNYLSEYQNAQNAVADQVTAILQMGGTPSNSLIARSGLSDEYVDALRNYYQQQAAAQTAARSGGRSGGGGSSRTYPSDKDYKVNKDGSISVKKVRQLSYQPDEGVFKWNGNQYTSVDSLLDAWEKESDLTNDDINILKRKLYSQMGRG